GLAVLLQPVREHQPGGVVLGFVEDCLQESVVAHAACHSWASGLPCPSCSAFSRSSTPGLRRRGTDTPPKFFFRLPSLESRSGRPESRNSPPSSSAARAWVTHSSVSGRYSSRSGSMGSLQTAQRRWSVDMKSGLRE